VISGIRAGRGLFLITAPKGRAGENSQNLDERLRPLYVRVSEPATIALVGLGLVSLVIFGRQRI
jgi:hypothetical protein